MESSFAQRLQAGSRAFVEEKETVKSSLDNEIIQDVLRAQREEEHSSDESDGAEPRTEPSVSASPDQQGNAVHLAGSRHEASMLRLDGSTVQSTVR